MSWLLAGCGGGSSSGSINVPTAGTTATTTTTTVTPTPINTPVTPTTATVVIQQALDKAERANVPTTVTQFRISGSDSGGSVVYGPTTVAKAVLVILPDVPLTVTSIRIDYLDAGGSVLFVYAQPVALVAGQTLTIADPAFTVPPGPAATLAFGVQPSTVGKDNAITPAVTVRALDANGNLAIDTVLTVDLALGANPGGSTLSGTTSAPLINGTATFGTLSLNNVGAGYTLVASATGVQGATSNTFEVTASQPPPPDGPVPAKLAFTMQPASGTQSGATFSVQVALLDANDQLVPTATNSVTMAIGNDPSQAASLGGTTTVSAVNGLATFPDLTLDRAGNGFTLNASSGSLTGAQSNSFRMSASVISLGTATPYLTAGGNGGVQNSNAVKVADFDHDGNLDIAVSNPNVAGQYLSILYGDGTGAFTEMTYNLTYGPSALDIGKFTASNPDFPDLACAAGADFMILLNNGNRTFTEVDVATDGMHFCQRITALDVNNDGKLDVMTDADTQRLELYLGDGMGGMTHNSTYGSNTLFPNATFTTLQSADINKDGKVDVVASVFNAGSSVIVMYNTGVTNAWFDNNDVSMLANNGTMRGVGLGDVNNDGFTDVAFCSNNFLVAHPYTNNGDKTFTAQTTFNLLPAASNSQSTAVGDIDLDGVNDLLFVDSGNPGACEVFRTVLAGSTPSWPSGVLFPAATGQNGRALAVGDFNKDTLLDVVTLSNNTGAGGVSVLLNTSH